MALHYLNGLPLLKWAIYIVKSNIYIYIYIYISEMSYLIFFFPIVFEDIKKGYVSNKIK